MHTIALLLHHYLLEKLPFLFDYAFVGYQESILLLVHFVLSVPFFWSIFSRQHCNVDCYSSAYNKVI